MTERLFAIDLDSTTSTVGLSKPEMFGASVTLGLGAMPFFTDLGQLYYWKHSWQSGEMETKQALERGEGMKFPNAQEAIRWLLSADE